MTKKTGDWRKDFNWMDKNDHPVDEATESPFEDYKTNVIQMMLKTGKRQSEVLTMKKQGVK